MVHEMQQQAVSTMVKEEEKKKQDFIPRRYQVDVFEEAKKRNLIALLETGAGKTMIAVMLIKELGQAFRLCDEKKLIIFLAPTVNLVMQQCEVIKLHTDFEVEEYYGAKGIAEWNVEHWDKTIKEQEVLVMTPQVLLDALRKAFLSLKMVGLMVFDECHRATGKHPYTRIMKEFYHKLSKKPKIFGMTATLVSKKAVLSSKDCEHQISEFESILDSQVYITKYKTELEKYIPSAEVIYRYHDQAFPSTDLKSKLESLWFKFGTSILSTYESLQSHYRDIDDKLKMLRKRLTNDFAKILYCLDELGLICALEAAKFCLENATTTIEECQLYREIYLEYIDFLKEVLTILEENLCLENENLLNTGFSCSKVVPLGYISPKLFELIQLLQSFRREERALCLVFVNRIVTAKVIERFFKRVIYLSHYTVSYLTGNNTSDGLTPKLNKETLESFRSGKVNLLFSTDVIEEGIHVPQCSCVIRFDLPNSVRSYVQSRGRARNFNSQFVVMLERGNEKQKKQMDEITESECSMTEIAINRNPGDCTSRACSLDEDNLYVVNETGAFITVDSSVSLIHCYCDKLPRDVYYAPKPKFCCTDLGGSYQCTLILPPNAAFQTIVGPPDINSHLAKQLVCLEACKKLHQMGALDNHLLPVDDHSESDLILENNESAAGAGTTKRKELHGTTLIRALCGKWEDTQNGATFHSYKIDFSCNDSSGLYSGFMLLFEPKLDDDFGTIEVELHLVSNSVKSAVSYCGQVHLNEEQITTAKCFQEFFFNGMFGKLVVQLKTLSEQKEFLLSTDMKSHWIASNMYLLLPLETLNDSSRDSWRINWRGIDSCTSVVRFLKKRYLLDKWTANSSKMDCVGENIIHFANNSVHMSNLKDLVVVAVHSGKIYSIVEVVTDSSAESGFVGNTSSSPSNYATFSEYFYRKYGISLMHPGQPLLRLKQSHRAHNLLLDFNAKGRSSGLKTSRVKMPKYVLIPPELLVPVDVSVDVLKSLYLLPSMMHRLESLMLASQLREEIGSSNFEVPSSLILEALTTLRCRESFSMERLELFGDSVLKYIVSCCLFFKYPTKQEGQLSSLRSWTISNATLHKLGTNRWLQGYIRDTPFCPRRWIAPGQCSLHLFPCSCGVSSLEVPLESKYQSEDINFHVGKCCDKGHRWMTSKTISDCVEALIGAYYVAGGLEAAFHVMKWLDMDVKFKHPLISQAINTASVRVYLLKNEEMASLESKLNYQFCTKGLLQEAITHASQQELGVNYSYQRLAFLGDAVLDLLITQHFFKSYPNIGPNELTLLRIACTSNENLAQVVVRKNLQPHIQHCSGMLENHITEYAKSFSASHGRSLQRQKGPKALIDMIKAIAGAILIDSNLRLDTVWSVFEPLLSPMVTLNTLQLDPLRELRKLCGSLGYFMKGVCVAKGNTFHAEITLQLKDALLVEEGNGRTKKAAKEDAAYHLLKELENFGISPSKSTLKRRTQGSHCINETSSLDFDSYISNQMLKEDSFAPPNMGSELQTPESSKSPSVSNSYKISNMQAIPVIGSISKEKGGPRSSMFGLCKWLLWPKPIFKVMEYRSRTSIEIGEGLDKRKCFNIFVSKVTLHIPQHGDVECHGGPKPDKKSSADSAALAMLYKLEQMGKIVIGYP